MLAGLVGVSLAAGLLLRGAWDLWAQSFVLLILTFGGGLWIAARAASGYLPVPTREAALWAGALALLSGLSAWASPVPAYAGPAWAASAAGLSLFAIVPLLSSDERARIDRFVRGAAWILILLAFRQKLDGVARPPSALLNQNAFAGAILLLIPLAVRAGSRLQLAALLLCLWWTKSVGAWLGLAAALVVFRRSVGPVWWRLGALVGLIGLVAAYGKLDSPEVLHRLAWWKAAWRMAADAPWLGLGPGAYAYAAPAYAAVDPDLGTLYAHQHFLETAAERGWPYLMLWAGGLAWLLSSGGVRARFGAVAALAHGLVDYPLSLPGVFWLFCYLAASPVPQTEEGLAVPARAKAPVLAAVLVAVAASTMLVAREWEADRLRARATALLADPRADLEAADGLLAESERSREHPEAARLRGEIAAARAARGEDERAWLERAAGHYARSAALNPWRPSTQARLDAARRKAASLGARP